MLARPEVAGMKLERMRMVVLLPAPLGPRKPTISPFPTSNEMLLIAVDARVAFGKIFDFDHSRIKRWEWGTLLEAKC